MLIVNIKDLPLKGIFILKKFVKNYLNLNQPLIKVNLLKIEEKQKCKCEQV